MAEKLGVVRDCPKGPGANSRVQRLRELVDLEQEREPKTRVAKQRP